MLKQIMRLRDENSFNDYTLEREIKIIRDGVEKEWVPTTWDDILKQHSYLKRYTISHQEEYITPDGNKGFRCLLNGEFPFYCEKVY